MKAMFIAVRPGKYPMIGYPAGDVEKSLREWVAANEESQVLVVTCSHDGFPVPGTAWVQTAEEFLDAGDEIQQRLASEENRPVKVLEAYHAEMLRYQRRMVTTAKSFLELDAYKDAAECLMIAEGMMFAIGRIPKEPA